MQNAHARKSQVQKKLIAAVAMLLVSCVLVVNSTYAWFTLSTAPELTGISTSVGANGNLEMALLNNVSGVDTSKIGSGVGTSMTGGTVENANITWGNLVSLQGSGTDGSVTDPYHLNDIKLQLSRLNLTSVGKVNTTSFLMNPKYGADGRVSSLGTDTVIGQYVEGKTGFIANDKGYGVQAVGTASSMTPGELVIRAARAAVAANSTEAANTAAAALSGYGDDLAAIALAYGLNSKQEGYTNAEMTVVYNTMLELEKAVDYVGTALKYVVLAYYESKNATEVHPAISSVTLTVNTTDLTVQISMGDYTVPTEATNALSSVTTAYAKMVKAIEDAKAAFKEAGYLGSDGKVIVDVADDDADGYKDSFTWAELSKPLKQVMDTDHMYVNGVLVSEARENQGALASSIMNEGLRLSFKENSGVFSDMAKFTGNFSANIVIPKVSYNSMDVDNMKAYMFTDVAAPYYLETLATGMTTLQPGDKQTATDTTPITDYYGYMIDLAFRTNAAGSNLLLQTQGTQRIYQESQETETLGGGSYMLFKSTTGMTNEQVTELMSAIRVVFLNRETGDIYGIACLTGNVESSAEGLKAYMGLVNYDLEDAENNNNKFVIKYRPKTIAEMSDAEKSALNYTYTPENGTETTLTASDYASYQDYLEKTGYVAGSTDDKWAKTTEAANGSKLMALTQNQIHKLSVLVYIDGDYVDNGDIVNAATAMAGTLNLQFASDATLTPMVNSDLMGESKPADENS